MKIRSFRLGDEAALLQVHVSAIHGIASRDYTSEQIEAWSPADLNVYQWMNRIQELRPFVVEVDNEIVGYADVQQDGYIDHFFVSVTHARQGVGTRLMARIHDEAASRGLAELSADVSKTAEAFFALHGFQVVERRFPIRRGVILQNALMRKVLA